MKGRFEVQQTNEQDQLLEDRRLDCFVRSTPARLCRLQLANGHVLPGSLLCGAFDIHVRMPDLSNGDAAGQGANPQQIGKLDR